MEELAGRRAKISFKNKQKGDVRDTYADISKAKDLLGYIPKIDIRKGLEIYLEWIKSNRPK